MAFFFAKQPSSCCLTFSSDCVGLIVRTISFFVLKKNCCLKPNVSLLWIANCFWYQKYLVSNALLSSFIPQIRIGNIVRKFTSSPFNYLFPFVFLCFLFFLFYFCASKLLLETVVSYSKSGNVQTLKIDASMIREENQSKFDKLSSIKSVAILFVNWRLKSCVLDACRVSCFSQRDSKEAFIQLFRFMVLWVVGLPSASSKMPQPFYCDAFLEISVWRLTAPCHHSAHVYYDGTEAPPFFFLPTFLRCYG